MLRSVAADGKIADLEGFIAEHRLMDGQIPWWAVSLVQLERHTPQSRVRDRRLEGRQPRESNAESWWLPWRDVVTRARAMAADHPMEWWREQDIERARKAALWSPRSFVEWVGLKDDDGEQIVLKDFHVRTVNTLRQKPFAVVLLPFEHCKTWLASQLIPLMDWAEWVDCRQGRIYLDGDTRRQQVQKLKHQVESNEQLHALFPWIRKPVAGDTSRTWNETSFSIGGRTLADASFEAYTIGMERMGRRFHRPIFDDVVTYPQSESAVTQESNWGYYLAGGRTMPQTTRQRSHWHTLWGTFGLCGTIFNPYDVNSRAIEQAEKNHHTVLRFDIWPKGEGHKDIVLWPEFKPPAKVLEMRADLGSRMFDLRCRNLIRVGGLYTFPEKLVKAAEMDGMNGKPAFRYGDIPPGARLIIGFDPASGKAVREVANPAVVLYGMREMGTANIPTGPLWSGPDREARSDIHHHIIEWQRLYGQDFYRQCSLLIQWARKYMCPLAIERNTLQVHYITEIQRMAPDVVVIGDVTTFETKYHPEDGVEMFAPLFENGKIIIHAADAPPEEVRALRTEFVKWRRNNRRQNKDLVMACWIARRHLQNYVDPRRQLTVTNNTPAYSNPLVQRYGSFGGRFGNTVDLTR